jgi:hypothetical protein
VAPAAPPVAVSVAAAQPAPPAPTALSAAPLQSSAPVAAPAPALANTATRPRTPAPAATAFTDEEARRIAIGLWRNDTLSKHPKGSCAGCHGADFFDLARIGSTDADLRRRALADGATEDESKALIQAVKRMRSDMRLPPADARQFRPFQPGGMQLLPGLSDAPHIAAVKRDIAFAKQLQALLPTLMNGRIDSLAKAQRAREELIDLANGTNTQGANPNLLNLRKLRTGVAYPRWSADLFHGKHEGTFNDWIADIAHDPKPEFKADWYALQDRYLAQPSTENFWRMYAAARTMTRLPLLGNCTVAGQNPSLSCGATDDFNKHKFLAALTGQHLMRLEASGKGDLDFLQGAMAFAYLDRDPTFAFMTARDGFSNLPADLWEIGDRGRVMIETTQATGSLRANLAALGYPEFAVNSIDADRTAGQEQNDLRLAWFWIGFTMDPSFARMHGSNATKVGEYMVGTLVDERMFNHNTLAQLMRLATTSRLQDANVIRRTRPDRVENAPMKFLINFSYFTGYNRTVLDTKWNDPRNAPIPQALKAESEAWFGQFAGNGFRMAAYLQLDEYDRNTLSTNDKTLVSEWLDNSINPNNGNTIYGNLWAMNQHFKRYHPATLTADQSLLETLRVRAGIATPQFPLGAGSGY